MRVIRIRAGLGLIFILMFCSSAHAQNYTSIANGNWTSPSTWNNTSGWGSATPPLSAQGSGTISVNHDISISANYNSGSATLNIAAGKTLTINGNLVAAGGSTINVSGKLVVTGNTILNSNLNILPGGAVYVSGNLTVVSSNYLTVGTSTTAPPYADLVVYNNLISNGSGDVVVNSNGRVAVFGNLTASGGGTLFTVNNGGQVYIDGNVTLTGGGSHIQNNNTTSPYGLYVNGNTSNSGGGSTTTSNKADLETMQTTNIPFYEWVANLPNSTLPVELLYFIAVPSNGEIRLEWATAIEKNADFFLIERSGDGTVYEVLDSIPAHGNSSTKKTYKIIDHNPRVGRAYYRLKEVDLDGSSEYFDMLFIDFNTSESAQIWPTVITRGEILFIQTNFTSEQGTDVAVIDLRGQICDRLTLHRSVTPLELKLSPGTYVIKISAQGGGILKRFVVQ